MEKLQSSLYNAPILVVDDDPVCCALIEHMLHHRGFNHVDSLDSGEKAMERIVLRQPELIIMDIHMAGLSGLDCCAWIRSQPQLKDLPVLILTEVADTKLRGESFKAGASDFISKPLHAEELYGRVKVHLLNRLGMKRMQRYNDRLQGELEHARMLQSAILPSAPEIDLAREKYKLDIASHLDCSSEIGGDFWGMKHPHENCTALWLVDFSGHGVAAALNAFRLQAYLKEPANTEDWPGEYLVQLNEKLLRLLLRGHFATMFYGLVETSSNHLHYACACSPHPLILRKDGTVEMIDGAGMPLGIQQQSYSTYSIDFRPGDTLVLYSDALTETPNAKGTCLSEEKLGTVLSKLAGNSAAEIRDKLLKTFTKHAAGRVTDDLTLCVCKYVEAP